MQHKDIIIQFEHQSKVVNFAELCYKTNRHHYKKRGQNDPRKIKLDIYHGKIAEYAVWDHYKTIEGVECEEPDLAVLDPNRKSYEADLKLKNKNGKESLLHIKTQTVEQSEKFGLSWMFQKNDPLVFRPLLNDFVVLTVFLSMNLVRVYKPLNARHLIGRYQKPKVAKIQDTKLALYATNIDDLWG